MRFIAGILIGILGTCSLWIVLDSLGSPTVETVEETVEIRKCMTQQVHLINTRESAFIIVGEAVICANDWQISNIYGPDAETWYGRIKLRDWDSEEFFIEEEIEENDTRRKND